MSGAIFANNVTIKISAGITTTANYGTGTNTLYTVPANSYAIVHVAWQGGGAGTIKLSVVGSTTVDITTLITTSTSIGEYSGQIYLGPGQILKSVTTASNHDIYVMGVCFVNSP